MPEPATRYFTSYSGVTLPLRLIGAIEQDALSNRNTYICATYDNIGRLTHFEKIVYGEVELSHHYAYCADGTLVQAEVTIPDEDVILLACDERGGPRP